jgi:MarR family 2-MHQ and catechol resistance regulon transcriptional repressor
MSAPRGGAAPASRPERALAAYVKLMRAADSVTARVHRHLAAHGLSVSQFGALEALLHLGPMCQRDIARKLLKSDGNLTVVLAHLERRGLVSRRREPRDRRQVFVELTPAGRALVEEVFPAHVREIAAALGALGDGEQETLAALCRKLGRAQED